MNSNQNYCPHCAYPCEEALSLCSLCGRSLNGDIDFDLIGRTEILEQLDQSVNEMLTTPQVPSIILRGKSGIGISTILEQLRKKQMEKLSPISVLCAYPNPIMPTNHHLYPLDRLLHHLFSLDDTHSAEYKINRLNRSFDNWGIDPYYRRFILMMLGLLSPFAPKDHLFPSVTDAIHKKSLPPTLNSPPQYSSAELKSYQVPDQQGSHLQVNTINQQLDFNFDFVDKALHSVPPDRQGNYQELKEDPFHKNWQDLWEDANESQNITPEASIPKNDAGWMAEDDFSALKQKLQAWQESNPQPLLKQEKIDLEAHLAQALSQSDFTPISTLDQISKTILPIVPKEEDDDFPETEEEQLKKLASFFVALSQKTPLLFLFFNIGQLNLKTQDHIERFCQLLQELCLLVPNQNARLLCILENPIFDLPASMSIDIDGLDESEILEMILKYQPDVEDPQLLATKLLKATQGEPKKIKQILDKSMQEGGLKADAVRRATLGHDTNLNLVDFDNFLTFASIAGNVCSLSQIKLISRLLDKRPWTKLNMQEEIWNEYLDQAVQKSILQQTQNKRFDHEHSYRFLDPDLKQEQSNRWYDSFKEEDRKAVHAALAAWMEAQDISPEALIQVKLSIAEHWILADMPENAAQTSFDVGNLLIQRGSFAMACNAYEQARLWLPDQSRWPLYKMIYHQLSNLYLESKQWQKAEVLIQVLIKKAWQMYDYELLHTKAEQLALIYDELNMKDELTWVYDWLTQFPIQYHLEDHLQRYDSKQYGLNIPKVIQMKTEDEGEQIPVPLKGIQQNTLLSVSELESPPQAVINALSRLIDAGYEAWVVGGSVRDRFLSREVGDWDLTTNATTDQMLPLFDKVIPTGIEHGTITVFEDDLPIEITTYRIDGIYEDGRRPSSIQFTSLLKEDLRRRDFTMNAIAWNPITQEIQDPFDGLKDLAKSTIRAVGQPLERFLEDGLRPLRAIRFAAVLGFEIEKETWDAIVESLDNLKRVAMERIQVEFVKLLLSSQAFWGLEALKKTGILEIISRDLCEIHLDTWKQIGIALTQSNNQIDVRLAILLDPLSELKNQSDLQLLQQLRFSNQLIQVVMHLLSLRNISPNIPRTDAQIRALVAQIQIKYIHAYWHYRQAIDLSKYGEESIDVWKQLWRTIEEVKALEGPQSTKDLAVNGRDICQILQIEPGRQVGMILNALLQHVWQNPQSNQRNILLSLIPQLADKL